MRDAGKKWSCSCGDRFVNNNWVSGSLTFRSEVFDDRVFGKKKRRRREEKEAEIVYLFSYSLFSDCLEDQRRPLKRVDELERQIEQDMMYKERGMMYKERHMMIHQQQK